MSTVAIQIGTRISSWLTMAGISVSGWIIVYAVSRLQLKRALDKLRGELQAEIDAARAAMRSASLASAEKSGATVTTPPQGPAPTPQLVTTPAELNPETVVMIAAAVTAFLGKRVRVRSAKLLQMPYTVNSPWAQQGRMMIQTAHNMAQTRHWD